MGRGWWWLAAADTAFRLNVCGSCLQNIGKTEKRRSWDMMKDKRCTVAQPTDLRVVQTKVQLGGNGRKTAACATDVTVNVPSPLFAQESVR